VVIGLVAWVVDGAVTVSVDVESPPPHPAMANAPIAAAAAIALAGRALTRRSGLPGEGRSTGSR
jgi:hypothetical protein